MPRSRASTKRASAERATRDSRRLSSVPRTRPRDAPARSGKRANRGGFFQPLARVREMRKRGAGNTRFAAAFFSPSRASTRRESAERETHDSRRFSSVPRARPRDAKARSGKRMIRGGFLQSLARVRETRKRGAGNSRFAAAFFNPSRASGRRESAERETCDSQRLSSVPRARPRDAPAWSRQRAIHGGFLQPLAHIREMRQRGAGNVRIAAAFFSPLRASARCESAEWATCDSRRFHSAPRARPRDAKARSGQRANRGGFLQPLVRIRETRKRGAGNVRIAAAFFNPSCASARRASAEQATRESRCFLSAPRARPRGAPARSRQRVIRGAFFNLSRASARRASAERATRDSRRLSSTSRAHPRDAPTDYHL